MDGGGEILWWIDVFGDDEVSGASFAVKEGVSGVDVSAATDDAAPGCFAWSGEGHLVGFERAVSDEDGVEFLADFEEVL